MAERENILIERKVYTPRPYQHLITQHILEHPRCAIWAGMGLGKTVSTLSAIDAMFMTGESNPVLVLAPLRVAKSTWPEESCKWKHLIDMPVVSITGTESERVFALASDAPVYTCNYDNLVWLVKHFGKRWPFRTVIADESTRLKSFRLRQGGLRAQALGSVAHTAIKRFVELTGTPSPNGLLDLWGQMWFLDAGARLGRTFDAFKQRWFQKNYTGFGVTPLPHAQREIEERLRDLCLTIDPYDWFDLTAPIVNNVYVELPIRARLLYKDMEREMLMQLEGHSVEAFNAAARTLKCLQLANGAAYVDEKQNWREVHDVKLQALESIVEETNGAPLLVAYHFKSDLERLQKAFPKGRVLDTSPDTIRLWNKGKIPLLFAHPASAGHGLNLQDGGHHIVFFSHWWNLEEYQQIIERIGPTRQMQAGHKRAVHIHNIIARDTMDEIVMERRDTKKEVQDLLLEAMKRKLKN
jgi:SNF2 family DNA or RNA helicase